MKKRTNRPAQIHSMSGHRACTVYQRTSGYVGPSYGSGKYKASPGDFIVWKSGDVTLRGRMVGMLDAPADGPSVPAVKGFILVMTLSDDLTHTYPAWVDPKDVVRVINCPRDVVSWLLSDEFQAMAVEDILYLSHYGTLSEDYIGRGAVSLPQRLQERDERLSRKEPA